MKDNGLKWRRLKELTALLMIGDGVLTAAAPKRHIKLWRTGPGWMVRLGDGLARRPRVARLTGVAAAAAGLYWASRQHPPRKLLGLW